MLRPSFPLLGPAVLFGLLGHCMKGPLLVILAASHPFTTLIFVVLDKLVDPTQVDIVLLVLHSALQDFSEFHELFLLAVGQIILFGIYLQHLLLEHV